MTVAPTNVRYNIRMEGECSLAERAFEIADPMYTRCRLGVLMEYELSGLLDVCMLFIPLTLQLDTSWEVA